MHDSVEQLKKISRNTRSIAKALAKYSTDATDPIKNVYLLETQCNAIEKRVTALPQGSVKNDLMKWLARERDRIADNKEEFKIIFGQQLKHLFRDKEIEIKGQYPLLRLGLYTLKINFEFGQATLFFGPEIQKIKSRIPLQPRIVFDAILDYDTALRAHQRSPDELLKGLYKAYMNALKIAGKHSGERVLLSDVLREFVILQQNKKFLADFQKSHFQEYPRVQLAYMLYRLKQSNASEHGLRFHVATFDATVDRLQSFWIPENEHGEGTHYSHLSFDTQNDLNQE